MPGKRKRAAATTGLAGSRAGAQQPQAAKPSFSRHTLPSLALHLSMLLPPETEAWPVRGVWPSIKMEDSARQQLMSAIACKLVPHGARAAFDDHDAGKVFTAQRGERCLLAKRGPGTLECGEHLLPDWLRQAYWNVKQDGRWQFRLRAPACTQLEDPDQAQQQHSALAAAVVARFVGTGKLVGVRRAEMLDCLGDGKASQLPWHAVHRLLCWDRHGPPPNTGKGKAGLLQQGHEGMNNACHSGCAHGESCLCVTSRHITWGRQDQNAYHKGLSRRARAAKQVSNMTKNQWA